LLRRWEDVKRLLTLAKDGLEQAKQAELKEEAEAQEAEEAARRSNKLLEEAMRMGDGALATRTANVLPALVATANKEREEADAAAENRGNATGGLLEDLADAFRALGQVELEDSYTLQAIEAGRQDLVLQESLFGKEAYQLVMPLLGLSQSLRDNGKPEV